MNYFNFSCTTMRMTRNVRLNLFFGVCTILFSFDTLAMEEMSLDNKVVDSNILTRNSTEASVGTLKPFYKGVLYNIVNAGYRAQQLFFKNNGAEWSHEIVGTAIDAEKNSYGSLFQMVSAQNVVNAENIVNAGGRKQGLYFKSDGRIYGSSNSREMSPFKINPQEGQYNIQHHNNDKDFLYFRDIDNDWT